jgi:FAD/FMN-containing dehydrogenase
MKPAIGLHEEELEGWTGFGGGKARVARPRSARELAALYAQVHDLGTTLGLRGAGTAFGDAARNRAAVVAELSVINRILAWDADSGQMTVEPGATFGQVWQRALPEGWWPLVAPDISDVSIGGAAATNLTGKESWRSGPFAESVLAFDLLLASGETATCTRERQPELFRAALGGLGLLGAFTSLTLQLRQISSGDMWEIESSHDTLDALLDAMTEAEAWAGSLVASLDPRARRSRLGRGLLRAARDLAPEEEPDPARTLTVAHQAPRAGFLTRTRNVRTVPHSLASALARGGEWRRGHGIALRRPHLQPYAAATFTLESYAARRAQLYPDGVLRHESYLPASSARAAIRALIEQAHDADVFPTLALLKRQRAGECLLDTTRDGYTLTLDFPLWMGDEERVLVLLGELNEIVLRHEGGCALGADQTLTPAQAQRMLDGQRLAQFHDLKADHDSDGLLCTDLYRRLLAPTCGATKPSKASKSRAAKQTGRPPSSRAAHAGGSGKRHNR